MREMAIQHDSSPHQRKPAPLSNSQERSVGLSLRRAVWVIAVLAPICPLNQSAFAQSSVSNTLDSCVTRGDRGQRSESWTRLAPNIFCDQERIWTYPVRSHRRKDLLLAGVVVGGAVGLAFLDHKDAPYFRRTNSFASFNNTLSGTNTGLATFVVPVAIYGAGLVRHDRYEQNTALLAGEAALDAELVGFVLKDASHRVRPRDIAPNGQFSDTWYDRPGWAGSGSFPSGHALAAFSIATVISRRYGRQHKWVPFVAYGGAALVGASRITTSAHFVSDVFVGAALGYGIGRITVAQ